MTQTIEELIQQSLDGELTAEGRQRLDRHLAEHPEDAARIDALRRQSALIAASVPKPPAAHLRALRQRADTRPRPALRLAASVAIFAFGLGLGATLPLSRASDPAGLTTFAEQARAAHALYVGEVLHPVEVAAADKDHLQSWLSNRLGAAIIAPQLGQSGYRLIGGRLLPAGDRASALFMYENAAGDRLSLVATHGASAQNHSFRFEDAGGYRVVSWQDGPWQYSLVGDMQRDTMGDVARVIHGQMI